MSSACPRCGSTEVRWSTVRRGIPVDVQQCQRCGHLIAEEDWTPPVAPIRFGNCLNCGGRREFDVCTSCGLGRADDEAVHEELRQLVAPQHDFLNAARTAVRMGRRGLALKLATASVHMEPHNRDTARALRVWLLDVVGEDKGALEDARAWVRDSEKPSALALASLGQQLQSNGYYGQAAEAYQTALDTDPDQQIIRARRSLLLLELDRVGQARSEALRVLAKPTDEKAVGVALQVVEALCERLGDGLRDQELRALIDQTGVWVSRSHLLLGHRARLAALAGDTAEARKDLKKARKIEPQHPIYERVENALQPAAKKSWWRW